jgi:hypothetical protein
MFDLERQIGNWRERLVQAEAYDASDLDELEAHLREEIGGLVGQGLSEQEAFAVARIRLGDTEDLEPEFAKVNGGRIFKNRLFWMAGGVLGLGYSNLAGLALSKGSTWLAVCTGLRGYAVGIVAETVHVVAVVAIIGGLLALAWRRPECLVAPAWLRSQGGKAVLFISLLAPNLVLLVFPYLLTAGTARMLNVRDLGEMALVTGYASLGVSVASSCILIGWVVKAWPSAAHTC